MHKRLELDEVFRVDGYGLIVTFSDGTTAAYTVSELAHLRPVREPVVRVLDIRTKSDAMPD